MRNQQLIAASHPVIAPQQQTTAGLGSTLRKAGKYIFM
jgi:hypothetical protein